MVRIEALRHVIKEHPTAFDAWNIQYKEKQCKFIDIITKEDAKAGFCNDEAVHIPSIFDQFKNKGKFSNSQRQNQGVGFQNIAGMQPITLFTGENSKNSGCVQSKRNLGSIDPLVKCNYSKIGIITIGYVEDTQKNVCCDGNTVSKQLLVYGTTRSSISFSRIEHVLYD